MPTESKRSDSKKPRGDKVAKRAHKVLGNASTLKVSHPNISTCGCSQAITPLVVSQLRRLTKKYPYDSPEELAQRIAKTYIGSLTTTGAAAGGVGAVPGIGTAASLGASFGAAIGFLELTSLYAQAVAELAGLHTKNDHESQTLVMTIMLGEDGRALLQQAASAQPGTRFGTLGPAAWIASGITGLTERAFNALSRRFMADLVRGRRCVFSAVWCLWYRGRHWRTGQSRSGREVITQTHETFGCCLSGITCRTYLMSSTLRANNSAPVNLRPLKSVPNRNWLHPMKIRHRTKQCCDVAVAVGLGCPVWLRVAPGTGVMLATQRR